MRTLRILLFILISIGCSPSIKTVSKTSSKVTTKTLEERVTDLENLVVYLPKDQFYIDSATGILQMNKELYANVIWVDSILYVRIKPKPIVDSSVVVADTLKYETQWRK